MFGYQEEWIHLHQKEVLIAVFKDGRSYKSQLPVNTAHTGIFNQAFLCMRIFSQLNSKRLLSGSVYMKPSVILRQKGCICFIWWPDSHWGGCCLSYSKFLIWCHFVALCCFNAKFFCDKYSCLRPSLSFIVMFKA